MPRYLLWAIALSGCGESPQVGLPLPPRPAGADAGPSASRSPTPEPGGEPEPGAEPGPFDDAVDVAISRSQSCAVTTGGSIWCWGEHSDATPPRLDWSSGPKSEATRAWRLRHPERVVGIAGGDAGKCAWTAEGIAWGWGRIGNTDDALDEAGDVVHCAVGVRQVCLVRAGGAVSCRGSHDEPMDPSPAPPPTVQVAVGAEHVCALTRAGTVWCWGETGLGTADPRRPVQVPGLDSVATIAAGSETACAVRRSGELWCWGGARGPAPIAGLDAVDVAVRGPDACAALRDGGVACFGPDDTAYRVSGLAGIRQIAFNDTACAVDERGAVHCWGANGWGQAGQGVFLRATPRSVPGVEDATVLSGGGLCALRAGGAVRCWGDCGAGARAAAEVPGAVQIVATGDDGCARVEGGDLICWGSDAEPWADLRALTRARIVDLAGTGARTCIRDEAGAVLCTRLIGPLAPPGTAGVEEARLVLGLEGATRLAVATFHVCAVLADGTVWCLGSNTSLETDPHGARDVAVRLPVQVRDLDRAVDVFVGPTSSCARREDGAVWCWGHDFGAWHDAPLRHEAQLDGAVQVALGNDFACGRFPDGAVRCVGEREDGQLGDGTVGGPRDRLVRPQVEGVRDLVAGPRHVCAITGDGSVSCWGRNLEGAVGAEPQCVVREPAAVRR